VTVVSTTVIALAEGVSKAMFPTNLKMLAVCGLVLGVLAQRPGAEQPRDVNTVSGSLESVDPVKNTVTIGIFSRAEGTSTNSTYTVAKDAKILKDGAPAKLADLKHGRATLQLGPDKTTVVSITVTGRTVTGVFFDAGKKTITIVAETRQGKENKTFTLAENVKVVLSGKPATLQDLKEGTKVLLTVSADDDRIIQVQSAP
jgi:hypothetical protein